VTQLAGQALVLATAQADALRANAHGDAQCLGGFGEMVIDEVRTFGTAGHGTDQQRGA